jgi:hypothetical protein
VKKEIPSKLRWSVECNSCRRRFIWETGDTIKEMPSMYCSRECRKSSKSRWDGTYLNKCPTPDKRWFDDFDKATKFAESWYGLEGNVTKPYRCECGGVHLYTLKCQIVGERLAEGWVEFELH